MNSYRLSTTIPEIKVDRDQLIKDIDLILAQDSNYKYTEDGRI
jgi:hypothetical protein